MEWVTTTARTVDEAKEAALDELGIDETEAEFEVLEEGRSGLFGFSRTDAKVRARIIPKAPRPKQERRPRRGKGGRRDDRGSSAPAATETEGESTPAEAPAEAEPAADGADTGADQQERTSSGRRRNRSRSRGSASGGRAAVAQEEKPMTDDDADVERQAEIITEFLEGLLVAIEVPGSVSSERVDEDTIELTVEGGDDLGLLIGPKGQTLTAVHELSRTVLQRRATGRHDGRVRIDIGGYRRRRAEALARFVTAQAEAVRTEGVARALEPMNSVDRKIVHDTVNDLEGVGTISEGADPNRRVVIVPDAAGDEPAEG